MIHIGVRGDGDIHNFGGGMLVRYDTNTGAYYEGALRVGTRYTKDFSNHHAVYAGLGVEHEFDGEAIAYYDGASTPSPRLKGTSGLIELGWSHNVGKARSTYQQIGVTGWFGRERGITAHANFGWVF